MIEKGKISALQMALMMYSSIIVTAILFLPTFGYKYAERDFWISPILSSCVGFMMVWVMCKLNNHYPKETIIQYSCSICGKRVGKIMGGIILVTLLYVTHQAVWEYGSIVNEYFLPVTPLVVLLGSMALVSAFAVRGGVEVMGRLAELITPLLIFVFVAIAILLLTTVDVKNILPILGNGILPVIKASYFSNIWFSEFMLMGFFLPFLTNQKNGKKWGGISVITLLLTIVILNVIFLLVLGNATGNFDVPLVNAIQSIDIADFLTHVESLVMGLWIAGAFIKIYVLFYVLSLGVAQWLNLSDYRPIIFPIAFLIVLLATWQIPNLATYFVYVKAINPILAHTVFVLLPLFLLLVSFMRKKKQQQKRVEQ